MLKTYLIVAGVAYLLGSIPFGYILVKLFLKQDIRQTGSGNIGATNVARSGKKGLAIATLLLDAAKGYVAVMFALWWGLQPEWMVSSIGVHTIVSAAVTGAIAALAATCGHVFSVWLGFKGGKGVATALGAFLAISPRAVGCALVVFAVAFLLSRYVSLSSVISAATFPIIFFFLRPRWLDPHLFPWILATSGLVILKHHTNIRRLLNGTEPKFGTPTQAVPADPIQVEKNA